MLHFSLRFLVALGYILSWELTRFLLARWWIHRFNHWFYSFGFFDKILAIVNNIIPNWSPFKLPIHLVVISWTFSAAGLWEMPGYWRTTYHWWHCSYQNWEGSEFFCLFFFFCVELLKIFYQAVSISLAIVQIIMPKTLHTASIPGLLGTFQNVSVLLFCNFVSSFNLDFLRVFWELNYELSLRLLLVI